MVYSNVNIPSSLNDVDMDYYVIDNKNMGSTINNDEEKMMDDLLWGHVCETKDSLHVEVQDVSAHEIGVNTIAVVSEPQVDDVDVNDA
nr:replication protein A 70 kDa DNA-binding subunit B [Tanacetum cinerariifolium]GFB39473.1 replication protein A 70 kDa DNA-binding subunit B [Tanacetum cinerariifolium]